MVEFDDNRERGPIPLAREAYELIRSGEDGTVRNMTTSVKVESHSSGGFVVELGFHEEELENPFYFRGAKAKFNQFPPEVQDRLFLLFNKPASHPRELGEDIGTIADILEIAFDLPEFEFVELQAASIGGMGELTDYEFKYETGDIGNKPVVDIDEAIEKSVISVWDQNELETIFGLDVG